ncbi:hypothetical protein Tco_0337200 [Tanacetum coccineum]
MPAADHFVPDQKMRDFQVMTMKVDDRLPERVLNGKTTLRMTVFADFAKLLESSKKQRLEEDKESDEVEEIEKDDEDALKKYLVIKKDDDIAIDVIPLATRLPVIVDYKLHKEGLMAHYELIRADGTSKRYTSMIRILQGIDREDLQTLWKLVKTNHGDIRPEDEHARVLWGDLKVMFEPNIKSDVWRNLQGYKSRVTTVSIKISTAGTYYCLCSVSAAGYKDTTAADLQLFEDLLLSRG